MTEERLWLEVRVPEGEVPDKPNLESIVNFAFNRGEVLEFVVACTPSPRKGMDRNSVRWFLGSPNEHTRRDLRGHLETEGFYVADVEKVDFGGQAGEVRLDNLDDAYSHAAELQATDHFAYGFLPMAGEPEEERTFEDYPPVADRLASALYPKGALKAVFRQDSGAETEAKHVAKGEGGEGGGPDLGILDGFFRSVLSFGSGSADWQSQEDRPQERNIVSELEEKMQRRAGTGLFALDVYLYGPPRQINSVLHSLPFSPVKLEVRESGSTSGEEDFTPELEPKRKRWRRTAKKWSHLAIPLLLALGLWRGGLWNPVESLESFWSFLPLPLIVASAILPAFFDFKDPIVLSHDELTLFISFPTNIANVPHEAAPEAEPTAVGTGAFKENRGGEAKDEREQG